MLTQEEDMDVLALHRQGFTITEIADELGYHPATISSWMKAGGPPPVREVDRAELLIDEWWAARIAQLLEINPRLLATSVYAIICAEGFEGSYPTVSRHIRSLRGPRFRRADKASVPIETAPGEECLGGFLHRHSEPGSPSATRTVVALAERPTPKTTRA
jgi:hypothetical protein